VDGPEWRCLAVPIGASHGFRPSIVNFNIYRSFARARAIAIRNHVQERFALRFYGDPVPTERLNGAGAGATAGMSLLGGRGKAIRPLLLPGALRRALTRMVRSAGDFLGAWAAGFSLY